MPSPNELKLCVHHIVYEYANLISSGTLLTSPLEPPCNTHVQDAFLLSCRKLADFFSQESKAKDDVKAGHFFPGNAGPALNLAAWDKWKKAMNKQLTHITYSRVANPQTWDGSRNQELLDEFRGSWKKFLSHLGEPYKTDFERAIEERTKSQGFGHLDLR